MARYAYTGPERRQGHGIKNRVGNMVSEVKDSVSEAAGGVSERAGELKEQAGERIEDWGQQARWQSRRLKTNLEHAAEENPLALAIGAAVVGLALGLLLPETQRENELMGPARDQLVDRAEETVERAKDAAVEAGREVKDTVKSEFEQHKPEMKEMVEQAGQTVKEQVKQSARKVKDETKDAATRSGSDPRSNA
jgi:gas vesicle protein